jgi:aminocarboxymuconate-semialdehyde decarboxylase
MITDIHCHCVPDEFLKFVAARPEFAVEVTGGTDETRAFRIRGAGFELSKAFFEIPRQVERMEQHGIERTILSLATPFIDYHIAPELAVKAARAFNDGLAARIAAEESGRLGGWAFLPMQDPQGAAAELRRCIRELGFVGGHLGSNVRGIPLHDPAFHPIFQAATDLAVPLFVHPADPPAKDRTRDFELTVVAGYLFDNTVNLLGLICSGFLDAWPRLKLVCAHAGAFTLMLRGRMQREVDTNPSLSSTLKAPVGDYLKRLYYDTVCFEPMMLRYAASVVPVTQLLLGSDAPFPLGEPDPVNFVRHSLDASDSEAVLRRNFDLLQLA